MANPHTCCAGLQIPRCGGSAHIVAGLREWHVQNCTYRFGGCGWLVQNCTCHIKVLAVCCAELHKNRPGVARHIREPRLRVSTQRNVYHCGSRHCWSPAIAGLMTTIYGQVHRDSLLVTTPTTAEMAEYFGVIALARSQFSMEQSYHSPSHKKADKNY